MSTASLGFVCAKTRPTSAVEEWCERRNATLGWVCTVVGASIMDNYGTHKTPRIRTWLAKRPRFHVHFTPTYGSWLNLVERWFAELTTKQLRRGAHRSVRELERAIWEFINVRNEEPTPFVWTKSADEILASIARFAERTRVTHAR